MIEKDHYFFLGVITALLIFGLSIADVESNNDDKDCPEVDTVRVKASSQPEPVRDRSVEWMARAIYSETKDMANMEYVGWVIRNRLDSHYYPGTVREVVLQERQFSAFNDYKKRRQLEALSYPETKQTSFRRAYRIAHYIMHVSGDVNPMPNVYHFHTEDGMRDQYGRSRPAWARQGRVFYQYGDTKYITSVIPKDQHKRHEQTTQRTKD